MAKNFNNNGRSQHAPECPGPSAQLEKHGSATPPPATQAARQTAGRTEPAHRQENTAEPVGSSGNGAEKHVQGAPGGAGTREDEVAHALRLSGINVCDLLVDKLVQSGRVAHSELQKTIAAMTSWTGGKSSPVLQHLTTEDLSGMGMSLAPDLPADLEQEIGPLCQDVMEWDEKCRTHLGRLATGAGAVKLDELAGMANDMSHIFVPALKNFRVRLLETEKAG